MKKYLFLIATAITLGFTSCSEDSDGGNNENNFGSSSDIAGNWYVEKDNEEMRFNSSGTFYCKYSNVLLCEEKEGRWEYNNGKLSYFYDINKEKDWNVKDRTKIGFVIYNQTEGEIKLERIVETYKLEVGETTNIQIPADYQLGAMSYTSNNNRLASVTANGQIKAEGEKGTTYIKVVTNEGNVWVKVVVGDDRPDLWYDYVSMMGMTYRDMEKTLLQLNSDPVGDVAEDGSPFYIYDLTTKAHPTIKFLSVFLNPEKRTIKQIQLHLTNDVLGVAALDYMDAHYYKFSEDEDLVYYLSSRTIEESKSLIFYFKKDNVVIFWDVEDYLQSVAVEDLWTDFTPLFGANKEEVKSAMDGYGYPFLLSDNSYSKNGSDYYEIKNNAYASMVGFVFNQNNTTFEFWVYMNTKSSAQDVFDYLCAKYNLADNESTNGKYVFYTKDKSLRVVFDLTGIVIYSYININGRDNDLDANYVKGTNMKVAPKSHEKFQSKGQNNVQCQQISKFILSRSLFKKK